MKQSAGILLYRRTGPETEFFLVHPGGPFFAKKHEGWWTIPKGEPETGEGLLQCAAREFEEETGYRPQEPFTELAPITQKGGKQVHCWAAQGDLDAENITCNTFEIEWPPRSGKRASYPEVDKAGWFTLAEAKKLINERQADLLDDLDTQLPEYK
jgi:predicted NUDIX family NTP pyrophosphohydrolase